MKKIVTKSVSFVIIIITTMFFETKITKFYFIMNAFY